MKIKDCISYQDVGEYQVDIPKLVRCFGKSYIYRNNNMVYRLVNKRAGVKVVISEKDAKELISLLKLNDRPSFVFPCTIYER